VRGTAPARGAQARGLRLPSDQIEAIDQLAKATNTRRRHLSVHERGRVILVPLEQVIYLKAELKYITVRTREREFLIEESLTSLEEEFVDRFVRIHRNALVARPSIAGFERVTPTGEDDAGDPYWQVVLRDVPDRSCRSAAVSGRSSKGLVS
jgi:two-component system response regulator AlgR